MNKREKIQFITNTLDKYFPDPEIPLHYKNTYTLLIAVLLSAQTTDNQVNQVTAKLFDMADTPQTMLHVPYDELLNIIKSCGLGPQKAKAILELSYILVHKYKGKVPLSFQDLEQLPGIGHKSAGVILSSFNIPAFPVDTHIIRLAHRWRLSDKKTPNAIEKDLQKIFPQKLWKKLHLQMIYFGRTYCTAKKHIIKICPICAVLNI